MATATVHTSYDEVPYESHAFAQSHPNNLATIATLFGMKPAPVTQCRVLELGCASGGNLIPMALTAPQSHFVGIDLSGRQIADGQKTIDALGLSNIQLKQMSIEDVGPELGEFDYVITHGIYSWVPAPVQDKILAVSKANLAPQGVAYVSYNTYPGWHMRGMIRDMMCYHARRFQKPLDRARQARGLLDFLAQSVKEEKNAYGILLRNELESLRKQPDSYLLHDHLEEVNDPVYFYQFMERAAAKGLQYLGEAEMSAMMSSHLPPQVEKAIRNVVTDMTQMEQYMDFVRNRMFRQTLLCHQNVQLTRVLTPNALPAFHVIATCRPTTPQPEIQGNSPLQFQSAVGANMSVSHPLVKAAMMNLCEAAPQPIAFPELVAGARQRVGLPPDSPPDAAGLTADSRLLGVGLLQAYTSQLVKLVLYPPHFARQVSQRPVASPLVRLQAQSDGRVTNLRHERVQLNDFNRQVVRLLDGTRDRAAVLDTMQGLVASNAMQVQRDGKAITDAAQVRPVLESALDQALPVLAQLGLLVA